MSARNFLPLLALLASHQAYAADKDMTPGMIAIGAFDLLPDFSVEQQYSDNIFHNNRNKKGSLITIVKGGGELALRSSLNRYALNYRFTSSQYHNSPADNFVDHNFGGNAHIEGNIRNRLDINATYTKAHNMRGTFFSQGDVAFQIAEPDQYHRYSSGLTYRYGRTDAIGNLGLEIKWNEIIYDNHRERTAQRDRMQFEITPGFYYRLMPKTYLTFQVQNTFVDYLNSTSGSSIQDYYLQRYLIGATWTQSSKTKGTVRFGYLQQHFNQSGQNGASGLTWDGKIEWSPVSYSTLTFELRRDVQPSIGSGSSRQIQAYSAKWKHDWPHRLTTELTGGYQESIASATTQTGKSGGMTFKFDIKYQMRPWLDLGANYLQSDFQGNTNDFASSQNIFMLYVNAKPKPGND